MFILAVLQLKLLQSVSQALCSTDCVAQISNALLPTYIKKFSDCVSNFKLYPLKKQAEGKEHKVGYSCKMSGSERGGKLTLLGQFTAEEKIDVCFCLNALPDALTTK